MLNQFNSMFVYMVGTGWLPNMDFKRTTRMEMLYVCVLSNTEEMVGDVDIRDCLTE